jgi:methylmalonyl-CoA mutase N-terminal domain/subunit
MSALTILKNFPDTKSEITVAIANLKEEILGGYYNPLEIDLKLKKIEEVIKGVREDKAVKSAVLTELEKYTEKTVDFAGCQISKVSRSSYDYDLCNDIELQNLEREAEKVNTALKDRQKFLQGLKTELVLVTSDGEIATVYPPAKKSTDTFSIKIL